MQTASRILGMSEGRTPTQSVNLVVDPGGQLEYYPGLTIPFADSAFRTASHSFGRTVNHGSAFSNAGRWVAHTRDEYLRFRHLSSRTTVTIDGQPVFADALEIDTSTPLTPPAPESWRAIGTWHPGSGTACRPMRRSR